ncbi:MAG: AsmA family protein, partial [Candidatus Acidiferrales bacterium]
MRRIPRWARIVLIVIAVLLVIGLAAPYLLDANKYRGQIIAAIEKETGRKAEIGNIEARLIPTIGIVIEGVSIGNPPNFAPGNLLEVESIKGSLAWMPLLLQREFKLSSIELVRPKIVLLEDARGRNNYDFGKQEEQEQPAPAGEGDAAFRIADIDSIEVSGVDITVARVMGNRIVPSIHAWDISADLSNVALDRKRVKQWQADANLKGVKVQLAALKDALEFTSGSFTLDEGKIDSKFGLALGKTVEADGTLKVADVENAVAEFDLNTSVLDLSQLAGAGAETAAPAPPPTPGQIGKSKLVAKGLLRAQKVQFAPLE